MLRNHLFRMETVALDLTESTTGVVAVSRLACSPVSLWTLTWLPEQEWKNSQTIVVVVARSKAPAGSACCGPVVFPSVFREREADGWTGSRSTVPGAWLFCVRSRHAAATANGSCGMACMHWFGKVFSSCDWQVYDLRSIVFVWYLFGISVLWFLKKFGF